MDIKILNGLNALGPLMQADDVNGEQPVNKENVVLEPESADIPKEALPNVPETQGPLPNPVGAYENYLDGVRDVETGRDKLYETQTFEGKAELIADSAEGFVNKFIDGRRTDEINALERKIDEKAAAGVAPEEVKDLRRQLDDLRAVSENFARNRKEMIQYVILANNHLKATLKTCKDRPDLSPEERRGMLKEALDRLREDIRKFRYEYDKHFELGVFSKTSGLFSMSWLRRRLDNLFSKSRWGHQLFNYNIERDQSDVKYFAAAADTLREKLGLGLLGNEGEKTFALGYEAVAFSRDLHDINSYIRGIDADDDRAGIIFQSIKSQIEGMAKEGGKKTMDVTFGIGGGFKVGPVDARILGRYRHQYRITCEGNGTVKVVHLNGGEIAGRADFKSAGLLDSSVHAEGGVHKLTSGQTFRSIDDAARYLSSGSKLWALNPVFAQGTAIGALSSWARKLFKRSEDIRTDDHAFVNELKERKILSKMAVHIMPGKNIVRTERVEDGIEKGGGVGGDAKVQAGPVVRLGGGIDASLTRHESTVVKMKPYLSSLEFDFAGEATRLVGDGVNLEKTPMVVTQEMVDGVKAVVDDGQATAGDVIGRLKELTDKIALYAEDLGGKGALTDEESVARKYRNTAILAVALFEKWEAVAGDTTASAAEKAEYDKFAGLVRDALVSPAVALSQNVFEDVLLVSSGPSQENERIVRTSVRFSHDLSVSGGKFLASVMGDSALTDALTAGVSKMSRVATNEIEAEYVTRTAADRGGVPWKAQKKTTINVKTGPDSLVLDAVLLSLGRYFANELGQPVPSTKKDLVSIVQNGVGASAFAAIMRLVMGKSENVIGKDAASAWFALGKMEMTAGRNIQIEIEDGRLRSIGFGDQSKIDLRLDLGQGVVAEVGAKTESVVNRNSHWIHPSFHSIVAKCESYCKAGNYADWAVFALQNRATLARFDKIVCAVERRRPEDLRDVDLEDGKQFESLRDEIDRADFSQLDERHRLALEGNRAVFRKTLAAIHDANSAGNDLDRAQRVKALLECVVRHYSLMDERQPLLPPFD